MTEPKQTYIRRAVNNARDWFQIDVKREDILKRTTEDLLRNNQESHLVDNMTDDQVEQYAKTLVLAGELKPLP